MTIELRNVEFFYETRKSRFVILDGVNYLFEKGRMYAVTGPSGCGKTTTLYLLAGLDSPQKGEVLVDGVSIQETGYELHRNTNVSIVFQSYNLLNYMNALQNVVSVMDISRKKFTDKKGRAVMLLKRLGIQEEKFTMNVSCLSGGEQQRVAIARALATDSPVLLADEPTGNLDSDTADSIVQILKEIAHEEGKCVIVVTHSREIAASADVTIKLREKKLITEKS